MATTKAPVTPPAPAQKTWFPEQPPTMDDLVVLGRGQSPTMYLGPKLYLYSYRADANPKTPTEKWLLVSLEGSYVSPGSPEFDQDDKRGWYTESVIVKMFFTKPDGLVLHQRAPTATEVGGSMTNSIGVSFSSGFFGTVPVGNVGASISNSITQSLPDFELLDQTVQPTLVHQANLRLVGGNNYRVPPDLVNPSSLVSRLCDLPPRAKSNMPLVSQALFHAAEGLTETRVLRIEVTHRLVQVEKTVQLGDHLPFRTIHAVNWDPKKADQTQHVHWKGLTVDIYPHTITKYWDYAIPFGEIERPTS